LPVSRAFYPCYYNRLMNWKMKLSLGILVTLIMVQVWFWDSDEPVIQIDAPAFANRDTGIEVLVTDAGRGLQSVRILLMQGDREELVHSYSWDRAFLPWQSSTSEHRFKFYLRDISGPPFEEGNIRVDFAVTDQPNLGFLARRVSRSAEFLYDTTPPSVIPVSEEHYLRQGGSEAILYRVSEDAESGVQVGENRFIGFPIPGAKNRTHIALFAMTPVQTMDVDIFLWAKDRAGNTGRAHFWCRTSPGRFRSRRINITDRFIKRVAPDILAGTDQIEEKDTPLETFLEINRTLRSLNNQQIVEITRHSEPVLLWTEAFLQLPNSSVEANFADFRRYYYQRKQIDEQTHNGFDLATTAHSPVESSNRGKVVFAGSLGIYGETVILDHGLGLFSLYGHLSSIEVRVGEMVKRRQILGRTGQTGLAGGDHLHFSMIVQGIPVNPIEWWDPAWVRRHVLDKYLLELEPGRPEGQ